MNYIKIISIIAALNLVYGQTTEEIMAENKEKLTDMQYYVTQSCGTEPAFNNEYWDNKEQVFMLILYLVKPYLPLYINMILILDGLHFTSQLIKRN